MRHGRRFNFSQGAIFNLAICHALTECDSGVAPGDDQQMLKTVGARLSNHEAGIFYRRESHKRLKIQWKYYNSQKRELSNGGNISLNKEVTLTTILCHAMILADWSDHFTK